MGQNQLDQYAEIYSRASRSLFRRLASSSSLETASAQIISLEARSKDTAANSDIEQTFGFLQSRNGPMAPAIIF